MFSTHHPRWIWAMGITETCGVWFLGSSCWSCSLSTLRSGLSILKQRWIYLLWNLCYISSDGGADEPDKDSLSTDLVANFDPFSDWGSTVSYSSLKLEPNPESTFLFEPIAESSSLPSYWKEYGGEAVDDFIWGPIQTKQAGKVCDPTCSSVGRDPNSKTIDAAVAYLNNHP